MGSCGGGGGGAGRAVRPYSCCKGPVIQCCCVLVHFVTGFLRNLLVDLDLVGLLIILYCVYCKTYRKSFKGFSSIVAIKSARYFHRSLVKSPCYTGGVNPCATTSSQSINRLKILTVYTV